MRRRIGITGHQGFIGQNLQQYLLHEGYDIVCLQGDVTEPSNVARFDCDTIVHLAGKNRVTPFCDDFTLMDANVLGTYRLAQHCLKNDIRLLVAGSTKSDGLYGASKNIAKDIVLNMNQAGLVGCYFVLCNVYGKKCKPFYNSFASTILWSIANDVPWKHLVQDWNKKITLIHISDVCKSIESLIINPRLARHVTDFCIDKEINISIHDFCKVALDEDDCKLSLLDVVKIQETLCWYRYDAQKT